MPLPESPRSLALIQELIDTLQDPDFANRFSAAQLGEQGPAGSPAVGVLLKKAIHDPDATVRLEAALALYKIGGQADHILPLLIRALQDPDEARCWVAADCLGEIGPEARAAVPALEAALRRDFKHALIHKGIVLALAKINRTQGGADAKGL